MLARTTAQTRSGSQKSGARFLVCAGSFSRHRDPHRNGLRTARGATPKGYPRGLLALMAFTAASSNSPGTYARCSDALEPLVKALSLPSRLGSSDASLSTSGWSSSLPDAAHAVPRLISNIRRSPRRATALTFRNDERPHAGAVRLDSLDDRPHSAVSPERARPTSTCRARP